MLTPVLSLLPVIVGMGIGLLMRRLAVASHEDGEFIFKLVFYVCVPALIFTSLSTIAMTRQLAVFLLAPLAVVPAGYVAARLLARRAPLTNTQIPVLVTASMMVNAGFTLPFVQALYGAEGVARIAVFDGVNATLTFTWAYYTAARGNPEHEGGGLLLNRLLRSPPLYGIAAGLIVNLMGLELPQTVTDVADTFGSATGVLISLGIGVLFAPAWTELRRASLVVGTRLGTGLVVGVTIVVLFGLDGADRTIMLLLSVAPLAFVTVTFASLENLDVRLATSALSLSLATSLVLFLVVVLLTA